MILEVEKTLTSLVPMGEPIFPEADVQGKIFLGIDGQEKEILQRTDNQEEILPGGLQGEVLQRVWITAIQAKTIKMTRMRMISGETPLNIPKHMGLEPDTTI